jgi:hypothetical protein
MEPVESRVPRGMWSIQRPGDGVVFPSPKTGYRSFRGLRWVEIELMDSMRIGFARGMQGLVFSEPCNARARAKCSERECVWGRLGRGRRRRAAIRGGGPGKPQAREVPFHNRTERRSGCRGDRLFLGCRGWESRGPRHRPPSMPQNGAEPGADSMRARRNAASARFALG